MKKINKTILRETLYIAVGVLILSLPLELVFILIGRWDYTVLLGNLWGGVFAVGNFFLMGLGVQAALGKPQKQATNTIRTSQQLRIIMMFVAAMLGSLLPCFNIWAALIPLLFPRLAIWARPLLKKVLPMDEPAAPEDAVGSDTTAETLPSDTLDQP